MHDTEYGVKLDCDPYADLMRHMNKPVMDGSACVGGPIIVVCPDDDDDELRRRKLVAMVVLVFLDDSPPKSILEVGDVMDHYSSRGQDSDL